MTASTTESDVQPEVDTPSADEAPASDVATLNDFNAAVDSIDKNSPDFTAAVAAYDKLDRAGKMKATSQTKRQVFAALDEDNLTLGKFYSQLTKALSASTGTAVEADPTEELVNRIAGIRLGYEALAGANSALAERVNAAVDAGRKDENSIPALLAKRLVETKMGRKPREGGGTRHNVGKHIEQVFANVADGTTLSIKQLADAKSEEYGDDSASVASITANLKSGKFSSPGLTVVMDGDKPTGVRKGATPEA